MAFRAYNRAHRIGLRALLTLCLPTHFAAAQTCVLPPSPPDAECVVQMPDGSACDETLDGCGAWLELDLVDMLTSEHEEVVERRTQVDALSEALRVRDAQVLLLRHASADYKAAVQAAEKRQAEAEADAAKARAWWRHPALWFAAGVVVTGGFVTTVAVAK